MDIKHKKQTHDIIMIIDIVLSIHTTHPFDATADNRQQRSYIVRYCVI